MTDEPLIDPQAWEALVAQLCGSFTIARQFTTDFVQTWPARFDRLSAALDAADAKDAHVALLSIRTGSEMVGAVRLAAHAAHLERAAHAAHLDECTAGLDALSRIGDETMLALAEPAQRGSSFAT